MIKKLKRRYLITNMLLLSSTLLVCLAVLFGFLYHSQISSSYSVMQEMMKEANMPEHRPENTPSELPTADSGAGTIAALSEAASLNTAQWGDWGDWGNWGDWNNPDTHDHQNDNDDPQESTGGEGSDSDNGKCDNKEEKGYGGFYQPPYWNMPVPDSGWPNDSHNSEKKDDQKDQPDNNQNQTPDYGQYPVTPPWGVPPWGGPWVGPPAWGDQGQWQDPNWQQGNEPSHNDHDIKYDEDDGDRHDPEKPAETRPAETDEAAHTKVTKPDKHHPEYTETKESQSRDDRSADDSSKNSPHHSESVTQGKPDDDTTYTETIPIPPAAGYQEPPQDQGTEPPAPLVPVHEGQYVPDAYVAQVDGDGNIQSYAGNDAQYSDDEHFKTVHHAIDEVKRRGAKAGTIDIGDNSYRFLYQPDQTGSYRLVLLDRTLELSTLSRLLFIFVLITVLGLLLMFGISVMLANWTVTPVAVAWEKQKQFVADASHELKTPLAVISANTEVILANPFESVSGQSKWLNYIQSETMRMSKLITNLLSVARMDSTSGREQLAPMSLSAAVSNVCLVFEPIIYENGKTLDTDIQHDLMLRAEEDNIKQLLSILLDNAVLHSVPDAKITVSLSKIAQNKIRLNVSNTAKDIPPEQLAHLFDRFYRLDTEGSPNGSGLGLSIAKSIVNQMGGTLSVTSKNQLVTFSAVFSV